MRLVRDQEVVGSNPIVPTISLERKSSLNWELFFISGPPEPTRTAGVSLRRRTLYPSEVRAELPKSLLTLRRERL